MFGRQRATEQRVDSHEKSSFVRVRSSHSLIRKVDLLFCRGDEPWSSHRPGIIYIVPTRYATVDEFKGAHMSRYMRLKLKMPKMPKKNKPRKPYTMKKKPRKPYTKKDPVRYALTAVARARKQHGWY